VSYEKELNIALNILKKASRLCHKVQSIRSDIKAIQKKDQSPVTIADFGSQAIISLELLKWYANDLIVAEEDVEILHSNKDLLRSVLNLVKDEIETVTEYQILESINSATREIDGTKRFWAIDPIDGTKGFLRGEQYAIALALVKKGEVVMGVMACPNFPVDIEHPAGGTGCVFHAIKGQGAYMRALENNEDRKIVVDSVTEVKTARLCESFERSHVLHDAHEKISSTLGITSTPCRIDSQAKYAAVARGDASIYLRWPRNKHYREKIWDHAAGWIIVKEAGGEVTDLYGNPLDFSTGRLLKNNFGVIVTNRYLHQPVLEAILNIMRDF
jgi:HAL2 family 3'(2'),5'-bisphosphate nucleotidase